MTVRKTASIVKALKAKGMKPDVTHHKMFKKFLDGQTVLMTRVSHGKPEVGSKLLGEMANQCALYPPEFLRLVDCSMSEQDWDAIIRTRCPDGVNPLAPRGRVT